MLAQVQSVTPDFLHQAALLAIGLLSGAAAAVGIYAGLRKRKIEPQPLEVTPATRYTTAEAHAEHTRRLDNHDADIRAIYAELKADRDKAEIHASQRSASIYREIGAVRKELSEKLDNQTTEFHQAMRELPAQLIAMLRNAGIIK